MSYISFDQSKEFDLVLLGRVAIDFTLPIMSKLKKNLSL